MFDDDDCEIEPIYSRQFTVGKARYRFFVQQGYEVGFDLRYGGTVNGRVFTGIDQWGSTFEGTKVLGLSDVNAVEVFRIALKLLAEYVWEHRPPRFFFSAVEPSRKSLYKRLVPRIEQMTHYKYTGEHRGASCDWFTFYRPGK